MVLFLLKVFGMLPWIVKNNAYILFGDTPTIAKCRQSRKDHYYNFLRWLIYLHTYVYLNTLFKYV
jgi:hypothetical protein